MLSTNTFEARKRFDPDGSGQTPLSIMDFEAEIVPRGDGTYRFGMEVGLIPPDDQAPAIIGALGGSAVEITIGAEMTTSLPNDVATKSGVSPDPF